MQNINPTSLQNILLNNQIIPNEGPKALGMILDFTVASGQPSYQVDLNNLQQEGFFSMLQTVYVDNKKNSSTLTIVVNGSGQNIEISPNTEGYYPVLAPNPVKLQFLTSAQAIGEVVQVFLINVPIAGVVWAAA